MKKKNIGSLLAAATVVSVPMVSGVATATPVTKTPDQHEHRQDFVNDDTCNWEADQSRHPYESWITNEYDRYNGTNSFTNNTDRPIQFSLEVTEGVNESVKAMSSGNTWEPFFGHLQNKYGIVQTSNWAVGDKLGPITVQPGETVRADYGVHMKEFIGRVRTCDKNTGLWRMEPYFGKYVGKGPSTRFVVWHHTTKEGDYSENYVEMPAMSDSGPGAATIDGKE
ncbi:hypothetical protein [Corynebacterium sp. sy039]|uniref:hypothetical protein n=1 Tax=Corynebacterium sp. sy039 TaxID=2599641 RepID=UPI0011B83035|nr:hypothetical protein [Corynebacterium sp. sy039]QDZ43400.1 hypothetical protein FQV43_09780 [Corynebacterium sp. sy039]